MQKVKDYEFVSIITTVKEMSRELMNVCDAFISRKIQEQVLRDVILHYANEYPYLLYDGPNELKPTVSRLLGKRRIMIVNQVTNGHTLSAPQLSLFT